MKKTGKALSLAAAAVAALATMTLVGCGSNDATGQVLPDRVVVGIELTERGETEDIYTVTYSDNTTEKLFIKHGSAGSGSGSGTDGGQNAVARFLSSCASVKAEFAAYKADGTTKDTPIENGSAVIYKMDADYTYFITNYHVVYYLDANADNVAATIDGTNQDGIARKIKVYLYGSEKPNTTSYYTDGGYYVYDYGDYAIDCKYAGGTAAYDIALLRADTDDVLAINDTARAVDFADDYEVGEHVYAVGNAIGKGLSATMGVVGVYSEQVSAQIGNKTTSHRSMRIDGAVYSGNSGGGVFNAQGKLAGIVHAGLGEDYQNINYAIPVHTVKSAADNIYRRAVGNNSIGAYPLEWGINFYDEKNSRYVYDEKTGSGRIVAEIPVSSTPASGSVAAELGLERNDVVNAVRVVGGKTYNIYRLSDIKDVVPFALKAGDVIEVEYTRSRKRGTTKQYTLKQSDFSVRCE